MASLARSDGRTFLTGTWQRKIKGVEDVFQLVFKDGVAQPDGSFVVEGRYIDLLAPFTNNSRFTAHLSIVTQTVPVPTVVVAMLQSQGETYR